MELALIVPVVALLTFGTIDLARAYRLQIRLENAAHEGATFGQVFPNDLEGCAGETDDIVDRVHLEDDDLSSHPGFQITVHHNGGSGDPTTLHPGGCGGSDVLPGYRLLVETKATFDVLTPLVENIVGGSLDIAGRAEVEVQG